MSRSVRSRWPVSPPLHIPFYVERTDSGANIRYFGALDPNLRKGWTEADDAALCEAMADENIDRFLLARRLGKSMDMVRGGLNHLIRLVFLPFTLALRCVLSSAKGLGSSVGIPTPGGAGRKTNDRG